MSTEIQTHTNANGENYYSRKCENGLREYSFTQNFEDIWGNNAKTHTEIKFSE